jgi:hypothetical protein
MTTTVGKTLSEAFFDVTTEEAALDWVRAVDREVGGLTWTPLGGIANNVHTVEVASDPAHALVERPTNSIDALLDLKARLLRDAAASPHEAAAKWWSVPAGGLSDMSEKDRRELADHIRVTMLESGLDDRPTIVVQDAGTGQHPDDFGRTLLSILESNKKESKHVMGVYNAGGAASYKFAKSTFVASRLAPELLDGRTDAIGATVVRYNPLDPERFKSGVYEYATVAGDILHLNLAEMPDLPYGTYVKLIEYLLPKYARGAHEPKRSLWHLFHAALPDPALPFRIIETRVGRFPGMKGTPERRVVTGLRHLLSRPDVAEYFDERAIPLGDEGSVVLRYFVVNQDRDPDAYTTHDQGLTIMLNGQRQVTKDRLWVRRKTELLYLYKHLVVLVDANGLTASAKRDMFSSTRESGVETPLAAKVLDRVVQELRDDEVLGNLDELTKQRTLEGATKDTTERVRKQLAGQIAAYLQGQLSGSKGGKATKTSRRKRARKPVAPNVDDSQMLDVPDRLVIVNDPLVITQGATAPLHLEINAKNGFLPRFAESLSVVFGAEAKDHVRALSKGRLLGGRVRVSIESDGDAPIGVHEMKVALVVQELGVLLTAEGKVDVLVPEADTKKDSKSGGEPDIDISWVRRVDWGKPGLEEWNGETVGRCDIHRDETDARIVTKAEWILNEDFSSFESVLSEKKLGEDAMRNFRDRYAVPVAIGLFKQTLAEFDKENEADAEGTPFDVPDDYVQGEHARLARAVLMTLEPEVRLLEGAEP